MSQTVRRRHTQVSQRLCCVEHVELAAGYLGNCRPSFDPTGRMQGFGSRIAEGQDRHTVARATPCATRQAERRSHAPAPMGRVHLAKPTMGDLWTTTRSVASEAKSL